MMEKFTEYDHPPVMISKNIDGDYIRLWVVNNGWENIEILSMKAVVYDDEVVDV